MSARGNKLPRGWLIAIGGAENKEKDCAVLKEFVRLAGEAKARIAVMTVATSLVQERGDQYKKAFTGLGASDIWVVDIRTREDAQQKAGEIEEATGIFFTGGNQLQVTSLIGGSELDRALHKKYEQGAVIAGTSAGAAMMSNTMIITGPPQENPRLGTVQLGPGLEFLMGGVIDTHFSERGRHGRLLTTVAQYPHDLGIGIDENTALVFHKDEFEVIGEGAVTIIDAGALTYTNVPVAREHDSLALYDIKLHVLTVGHRFNMRDRVPVLSAKAVREDSHSDGRAARKKSGPPKASSRRGK
jgi:cyanophycinase